jgi:glycosyltransferase involved in cell wall biosynthesis
MKIVHISHLYHPSEGGVQFFFKNVSERLVRDYGDDVTVVTTDSLYGPERKIYKNAGPYKEVINGVKVLRFPFRRWHIKPYSLLSKVLRKLSLTMPETLALQANGPCSKSMKDYLMSVDADAFCGSSTNYYYMQLPLWRQCNFFYFGSTHLDDDESKRALYPIQLDSIKSSTLYFANTAYEKARLEKLGVDPAKAVVLGVGVNIEDFVVEEQDVKAFRNKIGIPDDGLIISYIGRVERPKNVLLLVKSFLDLAGKNDKIYLLIAGSANTHSDELKEYCKSFNANITDRIKWFTNFSSQEKAVIFNAIDILVLPSHNESFGIVFLEAWSCEKPVIGTSIGAVRDVISDETDGLLININDEKSLTSQLLRLINDKPLRLRMGRSGYQKVKQNYTWDIIVSRLRKYYLEANA